MEHRQGIPGGGRARDVTGDWVRAASHGQWHGDGRNGQSSCGGADCCNARGVGPGRQYGDRCEWGLSNSHLNRTILAQIHRARICHGRTNGCRAAARSAGDRQRSADGVGGSSHDHGDGRGGARQSRRVDQLRHAAHGRNPAEWTRRHNSRATSGRQRAARAERTAGRYGHRHIPNQLRRAARDAESGRRLRPDAVQPRRAGPGRVRAEPI